MQAIELTPQLLAALPVERFGLLVRLLLAALPLFAAVAAIVLALGYGGGLLLALAVQKMWELDQ
ncbi:MAG: hypothetical protein Kow0031_37780 [Anaerolineae bacterium]